MALQAMYGERDKIVGVFRDPNSAMDALGGIRRSGMRRGRCEVFDENYLVGYIQRYALEGTP